MPFLNRIGSGSTSKFGFRMGFAPGAPTSVTASLPATYGNTTALVSWTAPVLLGSPAFYDYIVQYSSDSGTTWTTFTDTVSTATSVTVTGLTNGTAYIFRVATKNNIGTGTYSTASNSVTPLFGKLPTPIVPDIPETTSTIQWCYSNHSDAYTYNYYNYTPGQPPNDQNGSCHGWTGLGENVNRYTYVYVSQAGWANSDSIYLEETTNITDPCAGSPANGTVVSLFCSGEYLVGVISDGCNGTYNGTPALVDGWCGYVACPCPAGAPYGGPCSEWPCCGPCYMQLSIKGSQGCLYIATEPYC